MITLWNLILRNKWIVGIISLGFLLRILSIGLANFYHGNPTTFYQGADTFAWVLSFDNLVSTGTYTINFDSEYGYFGRMPGYTFYIGIFYFISGMNWDIALQLVYISQIVLDTLAIYLVFQISEKLFADNKRVALINSFLYATYPFIIIWNPIVFSEASSVFFLILGIWLLVVSEKKYHIFLVGVSLSISALMRPQVICIFPVIGIVIYHLYRKNLKLFFLQGLLYTISILVVYGAWPARNYLFHGKLIITQDIRGFYAWDDDVNAFISYLYSVDSSWDLFSEVAFTNKHVLFPKEAYKIGADSVLLESTIDLCRTCGKGFSYWKVKFDTAKTVKKDCNVEIVKNFEKLKISQIDNNPMNYYLILPLKNLKKALFKMNLTNADSKIKKMASLLFLYRSVLIILGFIGAVILVIKRTDISSIALALLFFFFLVYGLLCFGPTDQMRNIEMRYFIHVDVLLLFFAGYNKILPIKGQAQ